MTGEGLRAKVSSPRKGRKGLGAGRNAPGRGASAAAGAAVVASQDRAKREADRLAKVAGAEPPRCGPGQILRRAYYRGSPGRRTLVPPACVADPLRGKRRPGELGPNGETKGLVDARGRRVVIRVEQGRLERHGYALDGPERARRAALRRAVEFEGGGEACWLSLFRRLVLLSTWNKRKSPERAARARADAEYVKGRFGPRR